MSQTQEHAQPGLETAPIIQPQQTASVHGEEKIEGRDDDGRRWYHLRPKPRRRTDMMGFNGTWWALVWIVVIVVLLEPWFW
jgi:hypothetical protein